MVTKRRWLGWGVFGLVIISLAGVFFYRPYLADWLRLRPGQTKITEQVPVGERTLLIAPHPDDETLGGAGVIQRAIAAGKQIKVVVMTSGDGYRRAASENLGVANPGPQDFQRLGQLRHEESLSAMKHFGVRQEDVIFLGYPDGGVNGMWESNWDYSTPHRALNGNVRSPYPFAFEQQASYCGANVVKNLTKIIKDYNPTDIVYPDPNDQHHDHWATHAFVKYVLTEQNFRANEWTYLVHRGDYPIPWRYEPNLPLRPPHVLTGLDTEWIYLPTTEQQRAQKHEAIRKYATQTKVMAPFMDAFVRTNELLGRYHDPTIAVVQGKPDFNGANQLTYPILVDAHGDTIVKEVEPAGDISALGAVLADHQLSVGLQARSQMSDRIMYNVRLRMFRPDGVKRIDLTVHGTNLTARSYAANSLPLPPEARLDKKGERLWITLPESVVDGTTGVMISADTFIDGERVDKTGWRLLRR